MPDVVEAGRVAAQLSDWQTIAFFLVVVIALLLTAIMAAFGLMLSTVRKQAQATAETAAALQALSAAMATMAATLGRVEARLPVS